MQLLGGPYLVGSSMYGVDQITITSTFHIPNQQYPGTGCQLDRAAGEGQTRSSEPG
jgi:hypothetical protein